MSSTSSRYREIIQLSAPIAGIQFAQVALTTVDLLMMGLLGLGAVAAGGLGLLLYNQLRTMGVGMVTGVGNLVAGAAGRAEKRGGSSAIDAAGREDIRDLVRASLLIATVTGLVAGLLLVALGHLLPFLGQDAGVVALARPIMWALAPGLLPMLWMNVLRQFAVGLRRPGSLLAVTLVSIGVNAL
ncbi:multidrug transporter, partial [Aureimonas ureilytica]